MSRENRVLKVLVVASLLASFLLASCQPAQPAATPKAGETPAQKPAATTVPTKAPEKAAEKPVRGGTLRTILSADLASLDGALGVGQETNVTNNIFDSIVEFDQDGNATKNGLAKDWTISTDGKSITFKLREGVKFHDGTDFDAAAVKFNVERVKDPATKSPHSSNYSAVTSVDVVDNLTVRLNLKQPDPLLLLRMAFQGTAQMASPAAVKKYGQDYGRNPVGTGPFQLAEWSQGDHITLKRFDGYWKKDQAGNQLPYLDQVIVKIVPDASVAFSTLRAGGADLYPRFPATQLATAKADPNVVLASRWATTWAGVSMSTSKPPFDNKAVRQAVALAVDRQGVASFIGDGGNVNNSVFHPKDFAYDPQVGVLPARDVAKAKAKMTEAGLSGAVKVKMMTTTGGTGVSLSEIVKANLAEIGIEAEIEALANPTYIARMYASDYQIIASYSQLSMSDPGHILSTFYHSKGPRNNFGPYSSDKFDELVDKAGAIYDQKERKALYQEAGKLLADDVPFVPTYISVAWVGMGKKVRGWQQYADNADRFDEMWLAQ